MPDPDQVQIAALYIVAAIAVGTVTIVLDFLLPRKS
jgi:hypothetical protein